MNPDFKPAAASPRTTIVLASLGSDARLHACLRALQERTSRGQLELVVTRAGAAESVNAWAADYPYARFVACGAGATRAELRAAGMRAAGGDIVAFMDDAAEPDAERLEQLLNAYEQRQT